MVVAKRAAEPRKRIGQHQRIGQHHRYTRSTINTSKAPIFAMTNAPDTFRQGAGALRNARDWAKEKREELITAANGKALDPGQSSLVSSTDSFVSLSSNEPTHPESEMSADELALGIDTFASSSRRTLVRARTDPPPNVPSNRRSTKISRASKNSGTDLRSATDLGIKVSYSRPGR